MRRIAIDLGGTKTEIMLTKENPQDIIERVRVPTQQEKGYEYMVKDLAELINQFQKKCDETPIIGMGLPGSPHPTTQKIRNANIICLNGNPLKMDLEPLINNKIVIANDANCFALSEAILGGARGENIVFGVIMGTGVGGGLVISGKILQGRHGYTAEWGHTTLKFDGIECWCKSKGCAETYISGPAAEKAYQKRSGESKSLKDIYEAFQEGNDPFAKVVINELVELFGRAMANIIGYIDPDVIVLGGGVSNLPILYTEGIESSYRQLTTDKVSTPIVQNQLGDSSGIYGAALVAEDQ